MRWLSRFASPIIWFLIASTELVLRLLGRSNVPEEPITVAGLITIEDVLEEMVGDIRDEYDQHEESIVQSEDGSYLVERAALVREPPVATAAARGQRAGAGAGVRDCRRITSWSTTTIPSRSITSSMPNRRGSSSGSIWSKAPRPGECGWANSHRRRRCRRQRLDPGARRWCIV